MALWLEPVNAGNQRRAGTSKKETAFRTHLAVYLCVGLFLLTLNLLTSPFDLWFYWPLFFWGWGLAFHAVATYGADAPSRVPEVVRSLAPWIGHANADRAVKAETAVTPAPFAAQAFATVHERIEHTRELSWRITDDGLRHRILSFSAAAENTVASMARGRADAAAVRRFDADVLVPVASILGAYVDTEGRGDPDSREAARRLAEHKLSPLLERLNPAASGPAPAALDGAAERLRL